MRDLASGVNSTSEAEAYARNCFKSAAEMGGSEAGYREDDQDEDDDDEEDGRLRI